jgi:hypothetical protein
MEKTRQPFRQIQRQVDTYRESWQEDHEAAMQCREVEELLAVGIKLFDLLNDVNTTWRDQVGRGLWDYDSAMDQALRSIFAVWQQVTEDILQQTIRLETAFGQVEGARELRDCAVQGKKILTEWQTPAPFSAVGLRDAQFSEEAAQELDAILQAPALPTPRSGVQVVDPARFFGH